MTYDEFMARKPDGEGWQPCNGNTRSYVLFSEGAIERFGVKDVIAMRVKRQGCVDIHYLMTSEGTGWRIPFNPIRDITSWTDNGVEPYRDG